MDREGITYDHGKPLLPFNDAHPIDCRLIEKIEKEREREREGEYERVCKK